MIRPPGFSFSRPWAVAEHDGRISIVSADGASVTEIYPGQHLGKAPSTAVCRNVAEGIVTAVNAAHPVTVPG